MEQRTPDQLVEWAYDQFLEQAADMLAPEQIGRSGKKGAIACRSLAEVKGSALQRKICCCRGRQAVPATPVPEQALCKACLGLPAQERFGCLYCHKFRSKKRLNFAADLCSRFRPNPNI